MGQNGIFVVFATSVYKFYSKMGAGGSVHQPETTIAGKVDAFDVGPIEIPGFNPTPKSVKSSKR